MPYIGIYDSQSKLKACVLLVFKEHRLFYCMGIIEYKE